MLPTVHTGLWKFSKYFMRNKEMFGGKLHQYGFGLAINGLLVIMQNWE